ncbi:MAG: elongation factor Ts [Gammaproteobacteria bacterium]|nr:elongation factor Ts [Gammaproteobacteria bacterium]
MTVTAESVRMLRERTGAGMMECKKALVETAGDLDAAAELMRKAGLAKADRKAARIAAEGVIASAGSADGRTAVVAEVNCETDFVARQDEFRAFAAAVAQAALAAGATDAAALAGLRLADGQTVEDMRRSLVARIGENISVRRAALLSAPTVVGSYVHGGRIGALVALEGGAATLARDLAMHVAASSPQFVSAANVPEAWLTREREILTAQADKEGKPAAIVAKMVEGRLRKQLAEVCLTGQPFVRDPDTTVGKLLETAAAKVTGYVRFEVGEGIEKRSEDFAAEVMAQVKAAEARR